MNQTYVTTKLPYVINITKLITIHYFEFDQNFIFEGEQHDFWELVYVDAGQIEIRTGDEVRVLRQGDIYFHMPNEFHSLRSLDSPPNVFVISFTCKSPLMSVFEKLQFRINREIKHLFARIVEEANQSFRLPRNDPHMRGLTLNPDAPPGGEQMIKNYLELALILMIRELNQKNGAKVFPSKDTMENHLVTEMMAYINDRCESKLTVGDICATFGYSVTYLEQIFKASAGTSIAQYYNKARIDRAKRYIRENQMNFAQISERLAFDNPQYFSRVFKRVTRISPTEYKRSLQIK